MDGLNHRFLGAWMLQSYEIVSGGGATSLPLGEDPVGLFTFHDSGYFSVQLGPRNEDGAGYAAFFGTWTVEGRRRWLRGQWTARAKCSPEWWVLVFAVVFDGRAIGTQELTAREFPALRTVDTFSWLTRSEQGRGIGKEMRAAVLHLAFAGLGALRANSEAFEDNAPSQAVSRSLGYAQDGTQWATRRGQAAPMTRFRLDRDVWVARRRGDIEISGLEACLPLLGL